MASTPKTFRLDNQLLAELEERAGRADLTLTEFVRILLAQAVGQDLDWTAYHEAKAAHMARISLAFRACLEKIEAA